MLVISGFNRSYLRTLINLALPITLNQLIYSGLQMVDVVLVGQLGDVSVASVAVAAQVMFIVLLVYFGMNSGSAILTAQFWGKKNIAGIQNVLGLNLVVNMIVGATITILAQLFPGEILGLFSKDPEVIHLGIQYLKIHSVSYFFAGISSAIYGVLRSMENVRLPAIISIITFICSTSLGYLLIFGHLGLPRMGVAGAATANALARTSESIVLVIILHLIKHPAAPRPNFLRQLPAGLLRTYLTTTLPVGMNELIWSLGISAYNLVYARISTESIAAMNISSSIENLIFVLPIGIANACAIMVGNRIGAGESDLAKTYAKNSLTLSILLSLTIGLILILVRGTVTSLYHVSEITMGSIQNVLLTLSVIFWIKSSNLVLFIGAIRAGGDTRWAMKIEIITMWGVGVPLAAAAAFIFHLPVYQVYWFVALEEIIKLILIFRRFISGKWMHNLTESIHSPA